MADGYRDLIAWRKATDLALEIYRATHKFPKDEIYGLTSQMRRAAVSVASNIAEGKGRYSRKEFAQFLYRARGSLLELETQLFIAQELHYLEPIVFRRMEERTKELGRILNGLTKSVLEGAKVAS
ncbi:MAG: four helix bundle protein [Terriglobales bacterium]|jgi:four helix bundle protein